MIGKRDAFADIKNKREEKSLIKNKKTKSDDINGLIGNWGFDNWGVSYLDLSKCDFSNLSLNDLTHLSFSTSTIWSDKLPNGYNPNEILKNSIKVEENVKKLHEMGINGEGVTIAVIDSGFQAENHIEFKGANLVRATVCKKEDIEYHYHMENVLCKLCGQNLGSAPKANVLYYETGNGEGEEYNKEIIDVLEDVLKRIKSGEKIKAISCSFSIDDSIYSDEYRKKTEDLIRKINNEGCCIIDSDFFGCDFFCCGTTFLNDNLDIDEYHLASFLNKNFDLIKKKCNILCSGLAVLEYCNDKGYKYEVVDCFSWTIPKLVGMYALCAQVKPNITFDEFVEISKKCCDTNSDGVNVMNINKVVESLVNENKKVKSDR